MAEYKKSREEVEDFLQNVQNIIKAGGVILNNKPWKGRVNKTLAYMAETGIKQKDMEDVICNLLVADYSFSADDRNINFKDEQIWVFGKTSRIVDKEEDLYIKLKIRIIEGEMLLIMSFHPEDLKDGDRKLTFPYKE